MGGQRMTPAVTARAAGTGVGAVERRGRLEDWLGGERSR